MYSGGIVFSYIMEKLLATFIITAVATSCSRAQMAVDPSTPFDVKQPLGTLFRWKQMEFQYPTSEMRQEAINLKQFIPANVAPLGIERWKDRVFITTPRWKKGVPATLSSVRIESSLQSPNLEPYPNWDFQNPENCTGFTSVFRMNIDHCGVMWVLDAGILEPFGDTQVLCPPTLFAIHVDTNTVMGKFPIPSQFILQNSLFSNIVVDSRDAMCKDLHVYIGDVWGFALIVFRAEDQAFWKFAHYTFSTEPLLSNYTLHGLNFQWSDGLFGMSLGRVIQNDRLMYYHSMSASLEFVVKTSVIRNPSRVNDSVSEFNLLGQSRGANGQVSAAAIDRNGVMFFNLVSRDSIGCWDTRKPYTNRNLQIVTYNNNTLIFPNDLRIDHEFPQLVWIITNRLPMFFYDLINPNEFNYRVMYLDPIAAVQRTFCRPDIVFVDRVAGSRF